MGHCQCRTWPLLWPFWLNGSRLNLGAVCGHFGHFVVSGLWSLWSLKGLLLNWRKLNTSLVSFSQLHETSWCRVSRCLFTDQSLDRRESQLHQGPISDSAQHSQRLPTNRGNLDSWKKQHKFLEVAQQIHLLSKITREPVTSYIYTQNGSLTGNPFCLSASKTERKNKIAEHD